MQPDPAKDTRTRRQKLEDMVARGTPAEQEVARAMLEKLPPDPKPTSPNPMAAPPRTQPDPVTVVFDNGQAVFVKHFKIDVNQSLDDVFDLLRGKKK